MFSKFKILAVGAAIALSSTQAHAVTYSSGPEAAGSSVVDTIVAKSVAVANVSNVTAHLDAITASISAAVPVVTPNVAPSVTPGAPAPAPSVTPQQTSSLFEAGRNKSTVSLFDSAAQKGYGAANQDRKVSVWANMSYTWVESDATNANFDGDVAAVNIGVDKWFNDKILAGVSVGYAKTDIDTTFNQGDYEEESYTFAPYALFRINDTFNVSALVGHTWGDVEQDRQNGATTSETDAETLFAATTLTASKTYGRVGTTARLGYLWSERDTDGFTESDANVVEDATSETSQGRIGGEVSYFFQGNDNISVTPFVSVDYLYDFEDEINDDEDAFDTGLGLRLNSKDGSVDATLKVNTQLGRDDFDSTTASATLRFKF